jgi:hypothetical protein
MSPCSGPYCCFHRFQPASPKGLAFGVVEARSAPPSQARASRRWQQAGHAILNGLGQPSRSAGQDGYGRSVRSDDDPAMQLRATEKARGEPATERSDRVRTPERSDRRNSTLRDACLRRMVASGPSPTISSFDLMPLQASSGVLTPFSGEACPDTECSAALSFTRGPSEGA